MDSFFRYYVSRNETPSNPPNFDFFFLKKAQNFEVCIV